MWQAVAPALTKGFNVILRPLTGGGCAGNGLGLTRYFFMSSHQSFLDDTAGLSLSDGLARSCALGRGML